MQCLDLIFIKVCVQYIDIYTYGFAVLMLVYFIMLHCDNIDND